MADLAPELDSTVAAAIVTIRRRMRSGSVYSYGSAAALILSLGACIWLIARIGSPRTGELNDVFSDHIRHVLETWTFLRKGFGVYRGPFSQTVLPTYPHFDAVHVGVPWPDMPVTYPVGTFAFFLPPTLIGAYVPMATAAFVKVLVLYIVVMTHLALLGVVWCLRREAAGRIPILFGVWLFMLNMCLHGFYDGVWVGFGAMSISALAAQRPRASLHWFAAAAFTSLKAVSLAPVAAWALVLLLRSSGRILGKIAATIPTALACAQALFTVAVTFRYLPKPGTPTFDAAKSALLPIGTAAEFVIAGGVVVAVLVALNSCWLVAASALLATAVTIHHAGHSWHGAVLVPTALLPGALPSDRRVGPTRETVAMWMFGVWHVAFWNPLYAPIENIISHLK